MRTSLEPQIEVEQGTSVWTVRVSHPQRRGALTAEMYDALEALAHRARSDTDLRCVVITGTPGAFCAGTDVRGFTEFSADGADGLAYERRLEQVFAAIEAIPVPVLAAVDGPAMGGGLALVACCDLVVASDRARFGAPIAQTLGNCIPIAVVDRLERAVGVSRVRELLLLSERWAADDARAAGLVHRVCEADGLAALVEKTVADLTAGAPLTLQTVKTMIRRLATRDMRDEDLLTRVYGSADFREGITAFTEKRRPRWSGA
ncbi:enoyl-CoA hydratase-related protein [Ruania alba]|uniref:Enoyl-CoA hydratase/carnithine racemase n=1 Tax=Ruania alba TaxID=648782 RepID=A0A1H5MEM8_9MICO|nr:enoyl-CoA hydratase-related protein [Ruania alba]SEE87754.1 Enoyl-CoA hydratase/carnithine racemase [Ruania alba]